jgi:hypothetical protein
MAPGAILNTESGAQKCLNQLRVDVRRSAVSIDTRIPDNEMSEGRLGFESFDRCLDRFLGTPEDEGALIKRDDQVGGLTDCHGGGMHSKGRASVRASIRLEGRLDPGPTIPKLDLTYPIEAQQWERGT